MARFGMILSMLVLVCGSECSADETPLIMEKGIEQSSELHYGSLLPDNTFERYERPVERKVLYIQSRSDEITIKGLQLNRGNCDVFAGGFPKTLKFGEKMQIIVDCDVIEATAATDKGDYAFSWGQ